MKKNISNKHQPSEDPKNSKDQKENKRTNGETPDSNHGARPPQEEDYDFDEDPQAEKINNEKKDEYQKKNKNR
jgi:hypothetical protein